MSDRFSVLTILMLLIAFPAYAQHPSIHQLQSEQHKKEIAPPVEKAEVLTGLEILLTKQSEKIRGKTIGLVTNQSGIDRQGIPNYQHLMDRDNVKLKIIFTPEHGLFGEAAAGEKVSYSERKKDFPEIFSLYGNTRKPPLESLAGLDMVIYDIQDIGARFYTYISTLGLVMEAAAEAGIPVMVLDRPNPITGKYVEGPLLRSDYRSFVGYYPIPVRYGMTIGELARMAVGEKWIDPAPELVVIPMENWTRNLWYDETNLPWVRPSPNIPDLETALIYPGMCLIEGTNISEGRGTKRPFRWIGAPWIDGKRLSQSLNNLRLPGVVFKPVTFVPVEIPGKAPQPKYENETCSGVEIIITDRDKYESVMTGVRILEVIRTLYPDKIRFTPSALNRLWGSDTLYNTLVKGASTEELARTFQEEAVEFAKRRTNYFIYK
ncbi:MAG: DUF1343 domain-containing protein [FCB group bacterium]|nr:DUF1343 domain-containing protein [FCB group bacterium]